ncbi:unnamed protein product [Brassica oleracea]|uniref:Uncharacterized protein n=2 Tax=Brassica oleracea TaxID=3712 RepID=A0A0D3C6J9_BRAOL|nr:unnamed protein product [Brassica oleracea]
MIYRKWSLLSGPPVILGGAVVAAVDYERGAKEECLTKQVKWINWKKMLQECGVS